MNMILTFIANIPIYIAQVFALFIGVLSYIGSVFLAIGLETHKAFKTNTGKKLIEVEKTTKKVTDYMEKLAKQPKEIKVESKQEQESKRLFNIIKGNNNDTKG